MIKIAEPIYSIKIVDSEKQQAKKVRDCAKTVVSQLDHCTDQLDQFSSILTEIVDSNDIKQLRKEMFAFKHKIADDLNEFLTAVQICLNEWGKMITDDSLDSMKKSFVEQVRKVRDAALEFLEKMRDPEATDFLQTMPEIVKNITTTKKGLESVVETQLFTKIDRDILGKLKIGTRLVSVIEKKG